MRYVPSRWSIFTAVLFITLAIALPVHAQNRLPDNTLFTFYQTNTNTQLHWSTCGSLPLSEGCYGSGTLGPFTNACSIVQNVPAPINSFTVLRYIYVLDSGSSSNAATLYVYKRTDTVSQSNDSISVTLMATVPLSSLVGGTGVTCMLADNPVNVYAGTNQSTDAVSINKTTFAVHTVGAVFGTVTAIMADSYGFVTINQEQNGSYGNSVYDPNGSLVSDGGGGYFMINPVDGLNPADYPFTGASLPQVGYWPKAGLSGDK